MTAPRTPGLDPPRNIMHACSCPILQFLACIRMIVGFHSWAQYFYFGWCIGLPSQSKWLKTANLSGDQSQQQRRTLVGMKDTWGKVGVDICEWNWKSYLTSDDYFSNRIEVNMRTNLCSKQVIRCLKRHFAWNGTSRYWHSDGCRGVTRGERGQNSPGAKSQQCHIYILQHGTSASERPQVRTWGRQTCFLPLAPSISLRHWMVVNNLRRILQNLLDVWSTVHTCRHVIN